MIALSAQSCGVTFVSPFVIGIVWRFQLPDLICKRGYFVLSFNYLLIGRPNPMMSYTGRLRFERLLYHADRNKGKL
jgi:hypothetical protein